MPQASFHLEKMKSARFSTLLGIFTPQDICREAGSRPLKPGGRERQLPISGGCLAKSLKTSDGRLRPAPSRRWSYPSQLRRVDVPSEFAGFLSGKIPIAGRNVYRSGEVTSSASLFQGECLVASAGTISLCQFSALAGQGGGG